MKKRILFLVGPTGVGKSRIAIELARRLNGEIISADSMLVYKGMDIGTAKPSSRELKAVPHHLVNLFSPARNFSVFEYRRRALKAIQDVFSRNRLPIVAGGSGLYVHALLFGLSEQPPPNPSFRKEMEKIARQKGLNALYQQLLQEDSEAANSIKPGDKKRIIRALEIRHMVSIPRERPDGSGKSLVELGYQPVLIGLTKDREKLYSDLQTRVDKMMRRGLLAEVKRLALGRISRTASQAIGYREILLALRQKTRISMSVPLIKRNSRRLAKRQMTWFRRYKNLQWFNFSEYSNDSEILEKIIEFFQ